MKKMLLVVLIAIVMITYLFAGCSKLTKCEICQQEKQCKEIEIMGEKGWVCEDCKEGLDKLNDLAGALGKLG